MAITLSEQKRAKMIRLYFRGSSQPEIAEKAGVAQSSVSLYGAQFKKRVAEVGLLAAAEEVGVFNEVDSLRTLAVELNKAQLAVEDAKKGTSIVKTFSKFGVSFEQHVALAKACKKADDPAFIQAALQLVQLEAESGADYEEVVAGFQEIKKQLPSLHKQLDSAQDKLASLNASLAQKQQQQVALDTNLVQLQQAIKSKEAEFQQQVAQRMKDLGIKEAELQEVAWIKKLLAGTGLDIHTFAAITKEYTE